MDESRELVEPGTIGAGLSYARVALMLISSDHGPPESTRTRWNDLQPEYEQLMGELETLLGQEVPAFNDRLREAGMGAVYVPDQEM